MKDLRSELEQILLEKTKFNIVGKLYNSTLVVLNREEIVDLILQAVRSVVPEETDFGRDNQWNACRSEILERLK